MSNYTPITNFAAKDALTPGDPNKAALGTEITAELVAIQTAIGTKEDSANKGQANGYAPLNASSLLADTYLTTNIPRLNGTNTFSGAVNFTATFQISGITIAPTAFAATLLDDADAATMRTTLGLGTAALAATGDFATSGHTHTGVYEPADADITKANESETISGSWNFTTAPTISSIEVGYRVIPALSGAGGTAATTWRGKHYASTGGVTLPAATFAAGDSFVIYNNSASPITITRGASLTMYNYGTDSATVSLGAHDTLFVLYTAANVCVVK